MLSIINYIIAVYFFFEVSCLPKMFSTERKNKIIDLLLKQQRATVKELSQLLNVSDATLRADLNRLEEEGLIIRTHGGAMIDDSLRAEHNFSVREQKNREEKMLIGNRAAELIHDGQCILLDASSTALELARTLKQKQIRLTVVTNGLYTAMELKDNPGITVILIGGVLRIGCSALEGLLGASILNQINVDTMFTSASGFTLEDGLTDFNVYEVELKKAMINSASRVVALLDHTKIGKSSIASFAKVPQIETIITDRNTPDDIVEQLRKKQINVIIVEKA
jgi:DeoR/GlpR family transcriptional regulator of sugar metabolism